MFVMQWNLINTDLSNPNAALSEHIFLGTEFFIVSNNDSIIQMPD